MVDSWHDPVRLRQLQLPLLQGPAMAQYLRDRLAQRIAELEGKPTITPKPAAKSTAATRKNAPMPTAPAQSTASPRQGQASILNASGRPTSAVAQLRTKLIDLTAAQPADFVQARRPGQQPGADRG
jgi:hypothetical protein